MEVAYPLRERKMDVTLVAPEDIPFKNTFGSEVGNLLKSLNEKDGIKFKLNSQVEKFEGDEKVKSVILSNGERINCDFVVVGIGVKPGTAFIKGIKTEKDGSVKVDEYLKVTENVFASGDVATFPYNGNYIRIEHWRVAEQQGRTAGFNMAEKNIKYNKEPFFWTEQAGLHLRYVGYTKKWDDTITWGDINSKEFITFLVSNGKAEAAIGNSRDTEMDAIEFLLMSNEMPLPNKLKNSEIDLIQYLSSK
jgi:apoptosis-inducing factor 3